MPATANIVLPRSLATDSTRGLVVIAKEVVH